MNAQPSPKKVLILGGTAEAAALARALAEAPTSHEGLSHEMKSANLAS